MHYRPIQPVLLVIATSMFIIVYFAAICNVDTNRYKHGSVVRW